MHLSSLHNMTMFRDRFLSGRGTERLEILDLGSTEMGACYRPIFEHPGWNYVGADLAPGPNVDIVLKHPFRWQEVASGSVDVLVSGQVLEHVEYFWITMLEISRVLKPGGLVCLIVPSGGPEHRYPIDCWRFYPDGMRALANFGRLHVEDIHTQWEGFNDPEGSDLWRDSILVARKPQRSWVKGKAVELFQCLQREVLLAGLIRSGA